MSIKETLLKMSELVNELDAIVFDEGEFSSEFLALLTRAPESEQAAELDKLKEEAYFLRCRISHLENLVQQLQGDNKRLKKKRKRTHEANVNLGNYVRQLEAENEELKNEVKRKHEALVNLGNYIQGLEAENEKLEKCIAAMEEDCCC